VSAPDVVVIGDANPDVVLRGDVVPRFGQVEQLIDAAELTLGGSAAIVACGLARLGVKTALVGVVGNDAYGDFVRLKLAEAGVITQRLRIDPTTATGLTVVLSAPSDRAILTFPGTIPSLTSDAIDPSVFNGVRHVHVASPFLQPELTRGLPTLLSAARSAGASTSLDPNWDPSGQWTAIAAVLAHLDVLLPNDAELLALNDDPAASLDVAAAAFTAQGMTVVAKCGSDGGRLWTPDGQQHHVPTTPTDVTDTTGAGDSFDAGYLAARLDGLDPRTCLAYAVAAGSLSTRAAGGTGAQADRAELAAAVAAS
jgi:sugar/nucleoside kinase (ribokinase family)